MRREREREGVCSLLSYICLRPDFLQGRIALSGWASMPSHAQSQTDRQVMAQNGEERVERGLQLLAQITTAGKPPRATSWQWPAYPYLSPTHFRSSGLRKDSPHGVGKHGAWSLS